MGAAEFLGHHRVASVLRRYRYRNILPERHSDDSEDFHGSVEQDRPVGLCVFYSHRAVPDILEHIEDMQVWSSGSV